MERISILIAALILTTSVVLAADGKSGTWYNDWWSNVYEQRIEREQYEALKGELKNRCSTKLQWYAKKARENPKSEYYKFKLEQWKRKCPKTK